MSEADKAAPPVSGDYRRDVQSFGQFWAQVPAMDAARAARERFLAAHVETVYRTLTNDLRTFVRVERLVHDAARAVPGLVPSAKALAAENALEQKAKRGLEIDHGIFLAHILGHPITGAHLCHAMLLPRPEALARLAEFHASGRIELATATIERRGRAAIVTLRNPRFLNAEDEHDHRRLSRSRSISRLSTRQRGRGAARRHGRASEISREADLLGAGINLTHLYRGKIPFVWYMQRDMGLVNKIFRGLAREDISPDEVNGDTIEKPWIAAVDGFAIGGGCQLLLAMDYVVAASDAYMTLPARKEGIIPGAANLRLPRFVGDRIARQAILYGRRLDCDTPEGRLICDEIAPPAGVDAAVDRVIESLTSSGIVSAAGNRRALRVAQEPLDLFRRYMAVYAREQAQCHFSPALIDNLEKYWNAAQRKL